MAEKHKFLSPIGIEEPVETVPLAPRLNSVDGKTIHFCVTGEPDITIFLERQLKSEYPRVNWTVKKSATPTPVRLTEEERKTTDAVILAVSW
ncbi:MAG: hypothetical protein A2Z28_08215 [Chloroflexi bacterium RBG_16_51_9]|nr:MAG: hypothetical protein A2Z28_08215 [Chloroflexi bacterium RBG_16_51_9]